jgi:GTPase SAR1 family protein
MTKREKDSREQPEERTTESPHPALKLRHTLRGHTGNVYRMALSPDGRTLASPSDDATVQLWDLESGHLRKTLVHQPTLLSVGWSLDGTTLASGSGQPGKEVFLWNFATGRQIRILEGHGGLVTGVAWSPDGKILASCSSDTTVRLWDAASGRGLRELKGHNQYVLGVSWSPNGRRLCSGSFDDTVKLWNADAGEEIRTLKGHEGDVWCVAWSPNGQQIASGSDDRTVRIWDAESGQEQYLLEGHTAAVVSVSYLDSGRLLASIGESGAVIFWRTDTWAEVLRLEKVGETARNIGLSNLAVHPTLPVMAAPGTFVNEINIWDLDFALLRGAKPTTPSVFYVNAKAVLLGESGVGKSGLGIRMAEGRFRKTLSTHGAQFWHFPTERLPALPPNVQAELTLWDLAGQPEYRLTHQLFLDDTDAALLLFDCSDANDPFRGVPYWAKALKRHAPDARKLLVSARCDVSPVTVDRATILQTLAAYGLDDHFTTSASTGEGVEPLFQRLMAEIPWGEGKRGQAQFLLNTTW